MGANSFWGWLKDHVEIVLTFLGGTLIGPVVVWLLGRRREQADVKASEGDASESVANAAQGIVNAADSVVDLYREQMKEMKAENATLRHELAEIRDQVKQMMGEIQHLRAAFEYLCTEVESEHPEAVKIAREKAGIRKTSGASKPTFRRGD